MKKIIAIIILLLLPSLLASCSEYSNVEKGFYAGETVTPEQIAAISQEIFGNVTTKSPISNEPDVVYWTANGSVWHLRRDCSALARSTDIKEGSVEDAKVAGIERECSRCGG